MTYEFYVASRLHHTNKFHSMVEPKPKSNCLNCQIDVSVGVLVI